MGELRIMDPGKGDVRMIWDRTKPDEIATARESFNRLTAKRYLAFRVKGEGEKGELLKQFDPEAERIILTPPLQGGW